MRCLHCKSIFVPLSYSFRVHVKFFFPLVQRDERVLIVWSENLDTIVPLCRDFEDKLIKLVWNRHTVFGLSPGPSIPATPAITSAINSASEIQLNEDAQEQEDTPRGSTELTDPKAKAISGGTLWGWRLSSKARRAPSPQDVEKGGPSLRPARHYGPFYCGVALAMSSCANFFHFCS